MPTTCKLIAKTTVGSGGAVSIDWQNIPATYTDLAIFISGRSERSGTFVDYIQVQFNNSAAASYGIRVLGGVGSTASSSSNTGQTWMNGGIIPAATATASTFGSTTIYVPNYAGSTNKSVSIDSALENNSATNNEINCIAGLWSNTAAIDRITLTSQVADWAEGSTAQLYGITKA